MNRPAPLLGAVSGGPIDHAQALDADRLLDAIDTPPEEHAKRVRALADALNRAIEDAAHANVAVDVDVRLTGIVNRVTRQSIQVRVSKAL